MAPQRCEGRWAVVHSVTPVCWTAGMYLTPQNLRLAYCIYRLHVIGVKEM